MQEVNPHPVHPDAYLAPHTLIWHYTYLFRSTGGLIDLL